MKKSTFASLPLCAVALAALLVALTPGPVQAQVTNSDRVVVDFAPFGEPFTFPPDVQLIVPESETSVINTILNVLPEPNVVVFCEPPGCTPNGHPSDLLYVENNTLSFVSSDDTTFIDQLLNRLLGFLTRVDVTETGALQDVTSNLCPTGCNAPGTVPVAFHVLVQSDVEPVPEPSTWVLLGSGLAGLAYWRRRKA